jgi:hypothetical protein
MKETIIKTNTMIGKDIKEPFFQKMHWMMKIDKPSKHMTIVKREFLQEDKKIVHKYKIN